jgi:hypothetical protein
MLRTALIAACLAVAMPCFAQQVRVISGDIQHVYGPGAQLLDDPDLQARNERAWEHSLAEKQLAIQRRQVEIEMERLKLQHTVIASGMAQNWEATAPNCGLTGGWCGGVWFGGPTRGFRPRIGLPPRIGISPRVGFSRR